MENNLTDQQQAEIVKKWLKDNGISIVAFIAIGIGGSLGFQSFQGNQLKKSENASRLFSEIEFSVKQQRLSQAQTLLQEMDNNFANTPYQDQSHFAMAKLYMDSLDYDNAIVQLEFLLENSSDNSLKHIARLRISRILIEQSKLTEAMELLMSVNEISQPYQSNYESIKADIYALQGDIDNAQKSYQKALEMMSPGNFEYDFVKMKASEIGLDENNDLADES
ncbi:MAG: tetratricopeptide repeat protein [Gammaproteobacteria bacterium]|jgi:predicted negative regulator of RcsB-dependent stress response|nr:tetratricopeptide repeat protein [Gammaproteobacteria bacterium]MBT5216091.1 tetratricopeptide repeat protein [Gammaproteobacteria bacterium]MBT5542707.1 tetratricopeptide repeat protein [Gammaproteobacteria bacterium]MBT7753650.1 tetratricopeptide repeat protein [Gammaproteobacteria bacterium]